MLETILNQRSYIVLSIVILSLTPNSYPVSSLLEDNGYEATGDLSTFTALGQATAIANLIILRREKDTQNAASKVLEDVKVSPDGKELSFKLTTEIDVLSTV